MNSKKIVIISVGLLALLLAVFLYLRGDEDAWICVDNKWEKHGNPSSSEPIEGCGEEPIRIASFEECIEAGFPIMESYPRQCRDDLGNNFTETIIEELPEVVIDPALPTETGTTSSSTSDMIILEYPQPEQKISSPLEIKGVARGNWFFEASFPVVLTNWDGLIIAEGIATTSSDWMTEEYVPFTAKLDFIADTTVSDRGALILKKDNPSGLPENDDALEITIFFE